jgi:hypothetical protein
MKNSGWDMYVFRDGRHPVTGLELSASLLGALCRCCRSASERTSGDEALEALIAAGELECALLDDAGEAPFYSESCSAASKVTDALACAFLTGQQHSFPSILQQAEHIRMDGDYQVAVPEGFAYYALHPRKVAMLLDELALSGPAAVIGIRSIGVTLSAVACASLHLRGIPCKRISVRPTGHPYDRRLEITPELRTWVEHAREASFLVVDEGPGISGSSFLAVAEALVQCGVPPEQIHLMGSRAVDPATLRAANASQRWALYHFHIMQSPPLPPGEAGESLSGGLWRRYFQCKESTMPASWAPLEPAKFLSVDGHSIFKFEGFGHYGEAVGSRAKVLASFGFSPRYLGNQYGFGRYEWVPGRTLCGSDQSPELLVRMADYLALRSTAFASDLPQTPELEKMLRWNWQLEFDEELSDTDSQLNTERVVICDGRMMPHKWLCTEQQEILKLDAGIHGDNHFFPGPCDMAWDVAGAIVEWEMQGEVRERFIREYEARSGDAITQRLAPYLLAYTVFSMGWSKMASLAMQGEYDEALLERDYRKYRALAIRLWQEQRPLEILGVSEEPAKADPSSPTA